MYKTADLFTLTLLLACVKTNASVISTRTGDLISLNERLYDPDLYGSLYQETNRKKRLYLAPGLSELENALDNGSFEIDMLDDIPKDIEENGESGISNLGKNIGLVNVETATGEKEFQKDSKLHLVPEKSSEEFNEINSKLRHNSRRLRRWPIKQRTLSKLVGRQGKRYKAGVADRLAHGFGKRFAIKSYKIGDLQKIIENYSDLHIDPSNEDRSINEFAKLISGLPTEREADNEVNSLGRKTLSQPLVEIIKELLSANSAEGESERIKRDILQ